MPERDYRLYLSDISESCQAIFEYIEEMSFEAFCRDRKTLWKMDAPDYVNSFQPQDIGQTRLDIYTK